MVCVTEEGERGEARWGGCDVEVEEEPKNTEARRKKSSNFIGKFIKGLIAFAYCLLCFVVPALSMSLFF